MHSMAVCDNLAGQEAAVIRNIAETLHQLSALPLHRSKTCFDSESPPPISLFDYVERLWKHMDCSIQCFIIGMSYTQRILETHPGIRVGPLNVHTLTLSSLVVAAKFHDDSFRTNAYYARVGGVSAVSLYSLETAFMKLLGWRASITYESFCRCCDLLFCKDRENQLRAICQGPAIVVQGAAADAAGLGGGTGSQGSAAEAPATNCVYPGRNNGSRQETAEHECSQGSTASGTKMRHDIQSNEIPLTETKERNFYKLPADRIASTSTVCSLCDVS
eukprot:TRINITY_DN60308_c0_g1_i1.p1 TRINITY_DN60308_c0_g1~~TRINITY_DN60308_c0_g1_i1.p1  ORF type:complete len:275 (-),score=35.85 TRINITY_DN60308_c0_g1_i1:262-1086(-)